jgi:transposase-like protein
VTPLVRAAPCPADHPLERSYYREKHQAWVCRDCRNTRATQKRQARAALFTVGAFPLEPASFPTIRPIPCNAKHPLERSFYQAKWKRWVCRDCRYAKAVAYRDSHYEKGLEYARRSGVTWRHKLRVEMFDRYGWVCACCGEDDPRALTLDHVAGGGRKHRREGMDGHYHIGRYLRANGWPEGYQTLCWNCNSVKHFYPEEECHPRVEV